MAKAKLITIDGVTRSQAAWAAHFGISLRTVQNRITAGMSAEDALTQPARVGRPPTLITHNGVTRTITEWAKHLGICIPTLTRRVRNGLTWDEALRGPRSKSGRRVVARCAHGHGGCSRVVDEPGALCPYHQEAERKLAVGGRS